MREKCVLQFRCAKSGEQFCVGFQRANPQDQFKIVSIWITESQRKQTNSEHQQAQSNYEPTDNSFDCLNFDFTGWYCPHCGHKRQGNISQFVLCGSCRVLVCGGKIQQLSDGSFFFTCHDGCGCQGKLEGEIKSYQGIKTDIIQKQINPNLQDLLLREKPLQLPPS